MENSGQVTKQKAICIFFFCTVALVKNFTKKKFTGISAALNFTNQLQIVPLKPCQVKSHLQATGRTCVFKTQTQICPVRAGFMLRALILHSDLSSFLHQRHCIAAMHGYGVLDWTAGLLLDFPILKS